MRGGIAVVSLVLFSLLSACKDSTGPGNSGGSFVHPTGTSAAQITGLGGRPFGITVTSSGDILVTEQDLNRAVHVPGSGSQATNIAVGADPGDVVSNRAATVAFVSGFNDGTISFVNLATKSVTTTLHVANNAYRLALSADESRLFVSSTDGRIYVVNTGTRTVTTSVLIGGSLQGMALNHSGHALYVSSTSGTVASLDPSSLSVTKSVSVSSCGAQDVALSTDDAELYVACENGFVIVLDATSLATKGTLDLPGTAPFGLAVTPDNAQLYVASATTGRLTIVDRAGRSVVKTLVVTAVPRRVAFNAHGDKAYIANEGNWVDVIQ
jgi:YVTN family beta-propeller protein